MQLGEALKERTELLQRLQQDAEDIRSELDELKHRQTQLEEFRSEVDQVSEAAKIAAILKREGVAANSEVLGQVANLMSEGATSSSASQPLKKRFRPGEPN